MSKYKMCLRCVMDTTAKEITFDENGVCSFCHHFDQNIKPVLDRAHSGEGKRMLEQIVDSIRRQGQGKPYDSVLGLSGGTDSSYLTYLAREFGLRPLVVHVDTGWNSPESEANVKNLVEKLGFDLEIVRVDWEEMRDLQLAFYYPFVKGIREIRPLNYVPYNRAEAKRILSEKVGWQDYGLKHYESVLTRFYQGYYLPTKFGIDKRKAHLSSLILSGQISRDQALEELKKPPYPSEEMLRADKIYIAEKLGLSLEEWEEILALPPRQHEEFPNSEWLFRLKERAVDWLGIRRRRYGI